MNYNITYAREPRIEHYRVPTGSLPASLMASKYESQDPEEDMDALLDSQRRGILADFGPDTPFLISAEPARRPGGHSESMINLRTNGHRGEVWKDPYRPEEYYDFAGEREPRGAADGPDFSKLHEEARVRSRFQRLGPDPMKPQVIEGPIAETRLIADRSKAHWSGGRRMKIFDRQLTNAPRGAVAKYSGVSVLERVSAQNPKGDPMPDNYLPRSSAQQYVDPTSASRKRGLPTMTQDFGVVNYGLLRAGPKVHDPTDPLAYVETTNEFEQHYTDTPTRYKQIIQTMSDIVRAREQKLSMSGSGGVEMMESGTQQPISSRRPTSRDLAAIISSVETQDYHDEQIGLSTRAQKLPVEHHGVNPYGEQSHTADYILHNAQLFYKSVRQPEDSAKIREKMIVDRHVPETSESHLATKKLKLPEARGGANLLADVQQEHGQSYLVKSYGGLKMNISGGMDGLVIPGAETTDGHATPYRKLNHNDPNGSNNKFVVSAQSLEDTRMKHFSRGTAYGRENARQFLDHSGQAVGETIGEF